MFIVHRTYADPNNGQPAVKVIGSLSDQTAAEDLRDRCRRAIREAYLYVRYPGPFRAPDHDDWKAAALAALGALDPTAVTDPDNPIIEAKYTAEEVPAFVEPTEDPPANEPERLMRDIRDRDA